MTTEPITDRLGNPISVGDKVVVLREDDEELQAVCGQLFTVEAISHSLIGPTVDVRDNDTIMRIWRECVVVVKVPEESPETPDTTVRRIGRVELGE